MSPSLPRRLKGFEDNDTASLTHNKTIVIYGDPNDPWRTDGRFLWMFERYGFNKVAILEGGLIGWKKAGGTIERGRGDKPSPHRLRPETSISMIGGGQSEMDRQTVGIK